jgi:hypothetical protein
VTRTDSAGQQRGPAQHEIMHERITESVQSRGLFAAWREHLPDIARRHNGGDGATAAHFIVSAIYPAGRYAGWEWWFDWALGLQALIYAAGLLMAWQAMPQRTARAGVGHA